MDNTKSLSLSIRDFSMRIPVFVKEMAAAALGNQMISGKYQQATSFFIRNVVKYERFKFRWHKLLRGGPVSGWILIGFFTAYGIVCACHALWGIVYFFRCSGDGGWLILPKQGRRYASYYRWLRAAGILRCRIIQLDSEQAGQWQEEQEKRQWAGADLARPDDRGSNA